MSKHCLVQEIIASKHFKRETNFCFVYNYFTDGLLAWVANMDIQPMLNQHKAVAKLYAKLKCVHTYQRLRMNIYILRMKLMLNTLMKDNYRFMKKSHL